MLEMKLAPLFTKLLKDYSKDPVVMKLVLRILRMTLVNKKSYEILETQIADIFDEVSKMQASKFCDFYCCIDIMFAKF